MNATRTPWVERWVATACAACLGSPRALAQAAEETIKIAGQASLPHDLSPWGMFLGADAVVKGVLVGLVAASVVTWTVALVKAIELTAARLALARSRAAVERAGDLHAAVQSLERNRGAVRELAAAASDEIRRSGLDLSANGIKERIALRLQRIENADSRRLGRGAGVLATIGAIGPFVGLFGTVWGIMNSFIGISKAQTTNLAVVAPGIAEALLATAIGLAAAIPAVVVYNVLSRALAAHRAALADIATDILRTAGRDLDRHHAALQQRSPASSDRLAAE